MKTYSTGKRCEKCRGMGRAFDEKLKANIQCPACGGTGSEPLTVITTDTATKSPTKKKGTENG